MDGRSCKCGPFKLERAASGRRAGPGRRPPATNRDDGIPRAPHLITTTTKLDGTRKRDGRASLVCIASLFQLAGVVVVVVGHCCVASPAPHLSGGRIRGVNLDWSARIGAGLAGRKCSSPIAAGGRQDERREESSREGRPTSVVPAVPSRMEAGRPINQPRLRLHLALAGADCLGKWKSRLEISYNSRRQISSPAAGRLPVGLAGG